MYEMSALFYIQFKLTKIKRTRFGIANFALYFVEFLVKPLRFACELRLV